MGHYDRVHDRQAEPRAPGGITFFLAANELIEDFDFHSSGNARSIILEFENPGGLLALGADPQR